jgi:UDP-glucose 4-epimerase
VDNFFLGTESNLNGAKENYPNLKVYNQDAAEYNAMKKIIEENGTEVIFNLAIIPLPTSLIKPEWTFKVNVDISISLCKLIREDSFNSLIHYSSSEAYGSALYVPMDEDHKLGALTPYAASKAATDLLVLSYYKVFGIDTSIIRPFNNYGPRQNEKSYAGVIPITIKKILAGESPIIYGDGEQTRDYIYVTETADATIQIYNQKNTRGKLVNVGSGKETSINSLVKTIMMLLGCDKPIIYENTRPGDVRRHIADISLAKKLINFKQKIDLEEGMKWTIEWYKKSLVTTHEKN